MIGDLAHGLYAHVLRPLWPGGAPATRNCRFEPTGLRVELGEGLAQLSLEAVADNRVADLSRDGHAQACLVELGRKGVGDEVPARRRSPATVDRIELRGPGEASASLRPGRHARLGREALAPASAASTSSRLRSAHHADMTALISALWAPRTTSSANRGSWRNPGRPIRSHQRPNIA